MAPVIRGWMQDAGLTWLAKQAAKCHKIAEVGCFVGKSTKVLTEHCKGFVFAIDAWDENNPGLTRLPPGSIPAMVGPGDGAKLKAEFEQNLAIEIESGKVIPIHGCSAVVSHHFNNKTFDLVFLDANHYYQAVVDDIMAWLPRIRKGGILSGHDYGAPAHPGVKQAVDELLEGITVERRSSIWWVTV